MLASSTTTTSPRRSRQPSSGRRDGRVRTATWRRCPQARRPRLASTPAATADTAKPRTGTPDARHAAAAAPMVRDLPVPAGPDHTRHRVAVEGHGSHRSRLVLAQPGVRDRSLHGVSVGDAPACTPAGGDDVEDLAARWPGWRAWCSGRRRGARTPTGRPGGADRPAAPARAPPSERPQDGPGPRRPWSRSTTGRRSRVPRSSGSRRATWRTTSVRVQVDTVVDSSSRTSPTTTDRSRWRQRPAVQYRPRATARGHSRRRWLRTATGRTTPHRARRRCSLAVRVSRTATS